MIIIGIFAHNEAAGIGAMIADLVRQDIFAHGARAMILCNGCTDGTADTARAALPAGFPATVVELPEGGKSRTWNRFVHDLAAGAEVLVFADADIALPERRTLSQLVAGLERAHVFNSRPVKDISLQAGGLQDRLIAAAGGSLDDWRRAICGQLYAMRGAVARGVHMPIGLPVEDGFLRAMIATDGMTGPEDLSMIDGGEAWHVYGSERSVRGLIRHQTRIVIGSAVNEAVFRHLRDLPPEGRKAALRLAAQDADWLAQVLARRQGRIWGHVPLHFLFKRSVRMVRARRYAMMLCGFIFDLIVYGLAQLRMARGAGANYW